MRAFCVTNRAYFQGYMVAGMSAIGRNESSWAGAPTARSACRKTHHFRQAVGQATRGAPAYAWHMRQTLSLCSTVRKPKSGGFPSPTKRVGSHACRQSGCTRIEHVVWNTDPVQARARLNTLGMCLPYPRESLAHSLRLEGNYGIRSR